MGKEGWFLGYYMTRTAPVKEGGKVGVWRILPIGLADFFFFFVLLFKKSGFCLVGTEESCTFAVLFEGEPLRVLKIGM